MSQDDNKEINQPPEEGTSGVQSMVETARRILRLGPICDSCLGRQFAMLSTGHTNAGRGGAIKAFMAMAADSSKDGAILEELASCYEPARLKLGREGEDERCWVCLGQMGAKGLEGLAEAAVRALRDYEYDTFLVGTIMSGLLAENEELILADVGSLYAEPLKSELNREVGKLVAARTGKAADLKDPDIVVHLNLAKKRAELQVSSLYIYGRYRKLERGFPQTRWPCRECGGSGCERCNNTGRMYQISVDELIRDPVIEAARADDTVFHGAGREDIDALMLGTGRPFVVEAQRPMKRAVDLEALREDINSFAGGKVEVGELTFVRRKVVEEIKKGDFQKTYSVQVEFEGPVTEEKLKSILNELIGSVEQRTPIRVSHRRADKIRKREVYVAGLEEFSGGHARITFKCDGGLYIKELVSGDGGRTKPNLSEALGVGAKVVALNVTNVGGESDVQVTRD